MSGFFKTTRTFMMAMALLPAFINQTCQAEEPWTLAKDADGIKVYTRAVANSPLKEFKGEIILPVRPERVVAALKDAAAFQKWMPDVVQSRLLASTDRDQYHYLENVAPWPVSNRDGIYHFIYTTSSDGNATTTVRVEAAPDYLARQNGRVRVPRSDGRWTITTKGGGVEVTYQLHADPGGAIPSWLANSAVVDTPFKTLKNLRTYIQPATP